MKRFFFSLLNVFFTISLLSVIGCNVLKLSKEHYALQDKCEKQCEAWSKSYKQKYPSDEFSYKSHYNNKLNQCFILVKYSRSQLKSLKNINGNKLYGSFLSKTDSKTIICSVLENKCISEQEWDLLVKPYMED